MKSKMILHRNKTTIRKWVEKQSTRIYTTTSKLFFKADEYSFDVSTSSSQLHTTKLSTKFELSFKGGRNGVAKENIKLKCTERFCYVTDLKKYTNAY